LVFFLGPRPFHQAWLKHFLPTVQALHVRALPAQKLLCYYQPIVQTRNLHGCAQLAVFFFGPAPTATMLAAISCAAARCLLGSARPAFGGWYGMAIEKTTGRQWRAKLRLLLQLWGCSHVRPCGCQRDGSGVRRWGQQELHCLRCFFGRCFGARGVSASAP